MRKPKNRNEARTLYEALPDDQRMALQYEFGNDGIANREQKFYSWLVKNKKMK